MRWIAPTITAGLFMLVGCGDPEPDGGAAPPPSPDTPSAPEPDEPAPSSTAAPEMPGPYDPEAALAPESMTIEPSIAEVGQEIEVRYPGGRDRGIAYVLERSGADGWSLTHYMGAVTDGYGVEPSSVAVDDAEGYGGEDIGISGEGPDRLVVPTDAVPGAYRICNANSLVNICAAIEIRAEGDGPIPVESDGGIGDGAGPPPTEAPIVDVAEGVEFYPACGNEELDYDGTTWYQVQSFEYPDIYERAANGPRQQAPGHLDRQGFAPRVAEPGPGDDVGTLVVWSDGVAYFVSDSGDLFAWLVDEELTYDWVC